MTEPIPVVIADTSALVALFNDNDEHHKAVREGLAQTGHLVVSHASLPSWTISSPADKDRPRPAAP